MSHECLMFDTLGHFKYKKALKRLTNPRGFHFATFSVITNVQLLLRLWTLSQTNICCYDNTDLSIYRHAVKSVSPFEVVVKELKSLLVFGRKSQLLFLQSKAKGHAELLGSGEEGWTREAMADRCLQRPDCTSVTIRREKDFVYVCGFAMTHNHHYYHQKSQSHSIFTVRNMWWMLLFAVAKTLGSPVSLWQLPYPDGLGLSHQGSWPS